MQNNILQSSLNALMITHKLKHIKATLFFLNNIISSRCQQNKRK